MHNSVGFPIARQSERNRTSPVVIPNEPCSGEQKEAYDTGYSQAVTHPSTNPARPGLTSVAFTSYMGAHQYDLIMLMILLMNIFLRGFLNEIHAGR